MNNHNEFPELIKKTLNSREPKLAHDAPAHYRHAGVLIPLLAEDGVYKILFTKRTDTVEHHKGQISFPGGAADAEDETIEDTVLRESFEEIGLPEENVEILGRVDDTLTLESSFIVHPFVGLIRSNNNFVISKKEVDRIIKVPWDSLISSHMNNKTRTVEREGVVYETPAFEYNGDVIWGATAKIMENFINILK